MLKKYPSLFLLTCIGLGIALTDRLQLPAGILVLCSLAVLATAFVLVLKHVRPLGVILLGLSIGLAAAAHFSLEYVIDSPRHLRRILKAPEVFHVYGRVSDWPELKPGRTEVKVTIDSLAPANDAGAVCREIEGDVLLKISDTTTALQRGDRVALLGRIYPINRDKATVGFDYARFLHLRGVHGIIYLPTLLNVRRDHRAEVGFVPWVDRLRTAIRETFENNLSPVSAALAGGFLIGETRDIPPEIYRMFRDSGTLHLLAVSGSNVALVLLFLVWVMRPFGMRPGARAAVLLSLILVFAGLSYGDPSVIRASVMAGLVIVARLLGRPYDLNNIIALAAVIILLVAPAQLYDVGFQLSFITAWGLIFFVPKLTGLSERYQERRWYRWGIFPLVVCLVAQVCSTPIVAFHFGRIPWLALPANLVIVPMVAAGVMALLALLMVALVSPLLGAWVGSLVDLLLRAVVQVLLWFGGDRIPSLQVGDVLGGGWGVTATILSYGFLLLLGLSLHRRFARRYVVVSALLLVNAGLGAALIAAGRTPKATVEVHPVPGGALGVIDYGRQPTHDLVITSLEAKDYPLDERVFQPLLERLGVKKVGRLFVLSADFGALDDIARLARFMRTEFLCLETNLAPSWADLIAIRSEGDSLPPVAFFGGPVAAPDSLGLTAGTGVVHCALSTGRVTFVNDLSQLLANYAAGGPPTVLVIGDRWSPSISDCLMLRDSGITAFVCSKFEQVPGDWPDAEVNPDYTPPEFIHDLSRLGCWRLDDVPGAR